MRIALPRLLGPLLAAMLASGPALLTCGAGVLALGTVAPRTAAADAPEAATEVARKKVIKGIKSKLRRLSRSPYVLKKLPEITTFLDALAALGGHEAGRAAIEAIVVADETIRNKAFDVVESTHHAKLVAPLAAVLEDKAHRADTDLHKRIAHALAVMNDAKAVPPLTELIRTDIDAEVVEAAARALATYAPLKVVQKREAVQKLINLYATTYNLMRSMRAEDKLQKKIMGERYKVYGKTVRLALESMTSQSLSRPLEWRRWWNDNKKKKVWKPGAR